MFYTNMDVANFEATIKSVRGGFTFLQYQLNLIITIRNLISII